MRLPSPVAHLPAYLPRAASRIGRPPGHRAEMTARAIIGGVPPVAMAAGGHCRAWGMRMHGRAVVSCGPNGRRGSPRFHFISLLIRTILASDFPEGLKRLQREGRIRGSGALGVPVGLEGVVEMVETPASRRWRRGGGHDDRCPGVHSTVGTRLGVGRGGGGGEGDGRRVPRQFRWCFIVLIVRQHDRHNFPPELRAIEL